MFGRNVKVGVWFGVPVNLSLAWIIFLGIISLISPAAIPIFFWMFFLVLLHEFGHVFAAKSLGYEVLDVTLYPMGGAARMNIPKKPEHELIIALAGPAVNLALLPLFWYFSSKSHFFAIVNIINLYMIIFNLLPVFPMDGGRVLRSLLSRWMNNRYEATRIAARIGQVFCVLFVAFGLYSMDFMLALIGFFMAAAAQNELKSVEEEETGFDSHAAILEFEERMKAINRKYG